MAGNRKRPRKHEESANGATQPPDESWAVTPESAAQTAAALEDYEAGRTISVKALDEKLRIVPAKKTRTP